MKGVRLFISGDVQGVGFRAWTLRQAKALGLNGWVKNREDGTVEVFAEGEEDRLQNLLSKCRKGPDVSWVEHVDVKWETASGAFLTFVIKK